MYRNILTEVQQKGFGKLTAVCARPGDGRLTFSIEIANELERKDKSVCFASFSRTKSHLQCKLNSGVHILSAVPDGEKTFLKRLQESARTPNGFVIVDNVTALCLGVKSSEWLPKKSEFFTKMLEIARQRNIRVIVTDTFAHAADPDDKFPLPPEALALCDNAYILYKDSITFDKIDNINAGVLKLKVMK